MDLLEYFQTFWPVAVVILPLVTGAGFLWLRTQFPSKQDLDGAEKRINAKIDAHEARLAEGSKKLADLDKRVALVEEECESQPSKNDLNQGIAVLAGRMSGVESSVKGLTTQIGTQHDYLRTLIEKGLGQ